ncbi:MAG: tryptophan synthase subunit alpha [Acidobacteria bacterium]|nr:MAG: tryptophan synthase subunit alpha [Acidobacteriota bacterium]
MPTLSTSRIQEKFRQLREANAKGLVIYVTAGDPSLEAAGSLLEAIQNGGADIIELGIPFSDPLADGPVIQRASERALAGGTTLRKVLQLLPEWKRRVQTPLVLFSYYNPILQYGLENFAHDASEAGADGVLAVDLTPEESAPYVEMMRKWNLDTIFLGAPTSTDERLQRVANASTGFLYLIARAGVTGERSKISGSTRPLIERVRTMTRLPLAVGFGLSSPDQVRSVQELADAAVVGSAVVRTIEEHFSTEGAAAIERYVRWLKEGTGSPSA